MMDAAYAHPPGVSVKDNPQLTGLVADTALNMVGMPALTGGVPGLGSGVGKGIRAYHGSPHDFDRFDMSKIGTGEGAQAYGHGLYFAENPKVAQEYRDTLTRNSVWDYKPGFEIDNSTLGDGRVLVTSYQKYNPFGGGGTRREAWPVKGLQDEYPSVEAALADLKRQGKVPEGAVTWTDENGHLHATSVPGRMYEVNINAKPEQFLDWDKSLSQQPLGETLARLAEQTPVSPAAVYSLRDARKAIDAGALGKVSGSDAYNLIGGTTGRHSSGPRHQNASDILRDAGIPGIKYLDQGSRGIIEKPFAVQHKSRDPAKRSTFRTIEDATRHMEGHNRAYPYQKGDYFIEQLEGTNNYVLFRDDIIDILKKYGLAGLLGGGTAADLGRAPPE